MRLMRPDEEKNATVRSSAIWTKPDETRSSALWGKGGRGLLSVLVLVLALAAPSAGLADEGTSSAGEAPFKAYLSPGLLTAARENPGGAVYVIIQGSAGKSSGHGSRPGHGLADALLPDQRRGCSAHRSADRHARAAKYGRSHHKRRAGRALRALEQAALAVRVRSAEILGRRRLCRHADDRDCRLRYPILARGLLWARRGRGEHDVADAQ